MNKLWPYFKLLGPVKGAFIASMVCGLIFGVASGLGLPLMAQKVFPILFGGQPVATWLLVVAVLLLPAAFAVRGISGFFNSYLINYCGTYVLNRLRERVFDKILLMPLAVYSRHSTGDLLTRASQDTAVLQTTLTDVSNDLIKYPITLLGSMAAVVYLAIQQKQLLFILLLLAIIPICIVPIKIFGDLLRKRAHQQQRQSSTVTDVLNENIRGVREVRLYSQEKAQQTRFVTAIETLRNLGLKIAKYQSGLSPLIEFISSIGIATAIYYAYRVHLSLDVVIPLITALYMAYDPIKKLGDVHNKLRRGMASLERIEVILEEPSDLPEPANPVAIGRAQGEVVFDKVVFRYPTGKTNALEDFSLAVPAGMVVGIVGPSGAGKSTLMNLIPRLYEAASGRVLIDGIDTRELSLADLRRQIAVVPQDAFLFNDTVAANIALGDPNANEAKIRAAAQRAQAHHFIEAMPNGYQTNVGEAGGLMSGGQRQRLAIARAFYKDAPILLLDEPTSALDAEHEGEIFAAMQELAKGRTTFVVSHRLKSLHFCHKIAYIELGRLVAFATHEELMKSCEGYRHLYNANDLREAVHA